MVNQLLAKIDGVEQLNNILVIGKTTPDCVDIECTTIKVGGVGEALKHFTDVKSSP